MKQLHVSYFIIANFEVFLILILYKLIIWCWANLWHLLALTMLISDCFLPYTSPAFIYMAIAYASKHAL